MAETTATPVYVAGGTVQAAPGGVYLERAADSSLLKLCREGAFAFVLTSRQMGKSSLMIRTAEALDAEGVRSVIVDLTSLGADLTADQWYKGFLLNLEDQLSLSTNASRWWQEHQELGIVHRFNLFLRKVVLTEVPERVVIFVDEIDTTLRLPFTDDFFTAIRYLYNARADTPELARLSFVLLGVATPGDLIKDPERTPFNIGQRVDLTDFTMEEARPLLAGLSLPGERAEQAIGWVLRWTGGHPYLTLRVFQSFTAKPLEAWTEERVGHRIAELYFGTMATQDSNLLFVRDMLTKKAFDSRAVLETYRKIHRARKVQDEELSLVKSWLKLSGVVCPDSGLLRVRNRIYEEVFTPKWVGQHLGINWPRFLTRTGWAVLAALVLVALPVSVYRYGVVKARVAELDRAEALTAKQEALRQKKEAEQQRASALRGADHAQRSLARAELALADALAQKTTAERQAAEAEAEKQRATQLAQEALAEKVQVETAVTRAMESATRARDRLVDEARQSAETAKAEIEKRLAEVLAVQSSALRETQPSLSSLLAVESLLRSPVNPTAEQILYAALPLLPEPAGRRILTDGSRFDALSLDGSRALVVQDGRARVLDAQSGKMTDIATQPEDKLRFSEDGRWLFGFRGVELVRIDTGTGREVPFSSLMDLGKFWVDTSSLQVEGKYFTVSEPDLVHVWNLEEGSEVATIKTKAGSRVLAMSANARRLAIVDPAGVLTSWTLDAKKKPKARRIPYLHGANTAAFNDKGDRLAIAGSTDEEVSIWDVTKDSPPGKFRASLGQLISSLSFNPDGKLLLAAGTDGTVRIWSWGDQNKGAVNLHHESHVVLMSFTQDGSRLVTVTDEGVVRVWRTGDWTELARLGSGRSPLWGDEAFIGFSSKGDDLVTIQEATMERWKIPDRQPAEPSREELLDQVCKRLGRSLSSEEWKQYLGAEEYRETCPGVSVPVLP